MKIFNVLAIAFFTCLLLLYNSVEAQEVLKISSGAAPAETVLQPIKEDFEKKTGINLDIKVANSRVALTDLIEGRADMAAIGATLEDVLKLLEKDGIKADKSKFWTMQIGKDTVKVITNKSNPVKSLSAEQLREIWAGRLTNWKTITGKDEPIKIVFRDMKGCITNEVFSQQIMKGDKFTTEVIKGTTFEDILNKLRAEPHGITIVPESFADETVHVVETPEISRPLLLVTIGEPQGKAKVLVEYLRQSKK